MTAPTLVIALEPDEAKELGVPDLISIRTLADLVLHYWSNRIGA